MRKLLSILFISSAIAASPAMADGYTYQPDGCDFAVELPSAPVEMRTCHPDIPEKCEQVQSFTKVFDLNATINIYLTCRPMVGASRMDYNRDLSTALLAAQPGVKSLETHQTTFFEDDDYTVAGLLGAGPSASGNDVMIYSASFWVTDNSLLTVRGELIGANAEEADNMFSEILRNIHYVSGKAESDSEEKQDTDSESTSENTDKSGATQEKTESDSSE